MLAGHYRGWIHRRARHAALGAAIVIGTAACVDDLFVAPSAANTRLAVAYSLAAGAGSPDAAMSKADGIHVRVTGVGFATVDTLLTFRPDESRVSLAVAVPAGEQQLQVAVEVRVGAAPLFRGASSVVASSGQTNSVEVVVEPVPAGVQLQPSDTVLSGIGATAAVPAAVVFATGDAMPGTITWSSSDTTVAVVDQSGGVVARAPGTAVIRATSGVVSGSVIIRVRIPPVRERSVATGARHTCVLDEDGAAWCWGGNNAGQLGNGSTTESLVPVRVAGNLSFTRIAAAGGTPSGTGPGGGTTCAITYDGVLYCWGADLAGPGSASLLTPAAMSTALRFTDVAVGGSEHLCGIATDGRAYCRGGNRRGQLGTGDTIPRATFTPVSGDLEFRTISAGLLHTCGVDASGRGLCWGWNAGAQAGVSTATQAVLLPTVLEGGNVFTTIAAGPVTSCGSTAGRTLCWGRNYYGTTASGSTDLTTDRVPQEIVGGQVFPLLAAGVENNIYTPICGLTADGAAYCWGSNNSGQLGTTTSMQLCAGAQGFNLPCTGTPLRVEGGLTFVTITVGGEHGCGLASDERLFCWGNNQYGQIGDGSTQVRPTPVRVAATVRLP
jgi:alpha-tubulin suppressor-like RCC1 family protein